MSIVKDLVKQHKKLEIEIKKITKTRLNDRASTSWRQLKELKKKKLQLKDKKIADLLKIEYWTTIVVYKNNKEIHRSIGETDKSEIYLAIQKGV